MLLFALALVLVSNFVMTHAYLFKRGFEVNHVLLVLSGLATGLAVTQLVAGIFK